MNLRLEDGYNNVMRRVADPDAIVNPVFILREKIGEFKPSFPKVKKNRPRSTVKLNLTPLHLYN